MEIMTLLETDVSQSIPHFAQWLSGTGSCSRITKPQRSRSSWASWRCIVGCWVEKYGANKKHHRFCHCCLAENRFCHHHNHGHRGITIHQFGGKTQPHHPRLFRVSHSFSAPSAQPSSVSACWSPSLASSILLCSSCWIR